MAKVSHLANKEAGRNAGDTALKLCRPAMGPPTRSQERKRSHKRMRYRVEVMFGTRYGSFKGRLHNLSRSGAYIETAGPIPIGARVLATIPFRKKIGWVSVAGRVVRRDDGGIGLEFSR